MWKFELLYYNYSIICVCVNMLYELHGTSVAKKSKACAYEITANPSTNLSPTYQLSVRMLKVGGFLKTLWFSPPSLNDCLDNNERFLTNFLNQLGSPWVGFEPRMEKAFVWSLGDRTLDRGSCTIKRLTVFFTKGFWPRKYTCMSMTNL